MSHPTRITKPPIVYHAGAHWVMPGMATAHSHAFQRALRGRTQRRQTETASFWSWRGLMYRLVEHLDPEDVYHISRFAYTELAMSGVTAVGEFHYLHHNQGGLPYTNRTELAEAVIQAAKDVGIRICLIRTAYLRAGFQQTLEVAQHRFVDSAVDLVLQDLEALQTAFANDPLVTVAVAAHSLRAVPIQAVKVLADYATEHKLPLHMHICEQRRELEECQSEYGRTPVNLLADHGILSPQFVGIHGTHLSQNEIQTLGEAQAFVCLCRTTERDLGDGLPQTAALAQAGIRLCVGVDSHATSDAFEEIRAIELDDRSRTEARHVVAEAPALLSAATGLGYQAIGAPQPAADIVHLKANDATLAGIDDQLATDAIIFAATPRAVDKVTVGGQVIVENGIHRCYDAAWVGYRKTLGKLSLGWI